MSFPPADSDLSRGDPAPAQNDVRDRAETRDLETVRGQVPGAEREGDVWLYRGNVRQHQHQVDIWCLRCWIQSETDDQEPAGSRGIHAATGQLQPFRTDPGR